MLRLIAIFSSQSLSFYRWEYLFRVEIGGVKKDWGATITLSFFFYFLKRFTKITTSPPSLFQKSSLQRRSKLRGAQFWIAPIRSTDKVHICVFAFVFSLTPGEIQSEKSWALCLDSVSFALDHPEERDKYQTVVILEKQRTIYLNYWWSIVAISLISESEQLIKFNNAKEFCDWLIKTLGDTISRNECCINRSALWWQYSSSDRYREWCG